MINRYEWEDALIDAQAQGAIPNGALLVALKLAKAINWKPRNRKQSGLYWKNEDALKAVGASRASYFKHRKALFAAGFLTEDKGNLIPALPKSLVETGESLVETAQSPVETEKSLVDNPYTVDTYTEDVLSEDVSNDGPASAAPSRYTYQIREGYRPSLSESIAPVYFLSLPIAVEETPQSLVETEYAARNIADWQAIRKQRPYTESEKEFIDARAREHNAAKQPVAVGDEW